MFQVNVIIRKYFDNFPSHVPHIKIFADLVI